MPNATLPISAAATKPATDARIQSRCRTNNAAVNTTRVNGSAIKTKSPR